MNSRDNIDNAHQCSYHNIYFDRLIPIGVSSRIGKSIREENSSSSIDDDGITERLSDFNRSLRRGRTRSRTSRECRSEHVHGAALTRGFSPRKASRRTVHEYEQTDPRETRGWRLPSKIREKDKQGGA